MESRAKQRDPLILLLPLVILSSSCRAEPPRNPQPANVTTPAAAYVPVYGVRAGSEREPRGSLRGDFHWALDAGTLSDAAQRWQEFLTKHSPPGAEYEDGMHASYAKAARYELMRLNYLLGRVAEGDALLKELDPVGWLK